MSGETITLELREATTEQLEKALAEAKKGEQACRDQKSFPQAWQRRRELLESILSRRPTPQPVVTLGEVKEAALEPVRAQLGMLGMMLRENQRHEEGDRNHYDEKGERTHPRRLMHDGKAAAYRHAAANLAPILYSIDHAFSDREGER